MYRIENAKMLEFFQADGEVKHFYACHNIVNAGGERYGIKSVEFYTDEPDTPKPEYVEFTANLFGEVSAYINTTDNTLIADMCEKIIALQNEYARISVETPRHIDLSANPAILEKFDVSNVYESELGVYGLLSADRVPPLTVPAGVDVRLASPEEIEAVKRFDNREWLGLPMRLNHNFNPEEDLLFLLYSGGLPAGALAASGRYKNFRAFDIAAKSAD